MGNVRCKSCSEEFSSKEKRCPHCGEKRSKGGKRVKHTRSSTIKVIVAAAVLVVLIAVIVVLLVTLLGGKTPADKPDSGIGKPGVSDTVPGDDTNTPDSGDTVVLESIAIDITEVTLRADSPTVQLHAMTYPTDANVEILWGSSEPLIASVDEKGLVTGVGSGTCEIYAYCQDKIAVCTVTSYVEGDAGGSSSGDSSVSDAGKLEVKSIYTSNVLTDFTMKVGESVPLRLYNDGERVTDGVEWTSDGGSVTIDSDGNAKGVSSTGGGYATITASYGGKSVDVIVRVR
ncbi:MAG: Ig-like domain-containing protein, partial [Oscillospiraceae bacterium]|nr:Ig-like domain-containing protein [Oscillospiraceae bacterium]